MGCLTLGNSKISVSNIFVCEKIAKVERTEAKFVFQRRETKKNTLYLFHGPETCFILQFRYSSVFLTLSFVRIVLF